jgi:four helix bundle protein
MDHEKLDVYQASLQFVELAGAVVQRIPHGQRYLADQLQRAASSISLNICEGAGEFSKKEKCRFYRMALRSGTECSAIIDIASRFSLLDGDTHRRNHDLLDRIVGMLTKLIASHAGQD